MGQTLSVLGSSPEMSNDKIKSQVIKGEPLPTGKQ